MSKKQRHSDGFYYPRDATLARVQGMALCLSVSVCLSQICCVEIGKRIKLHGFGVEDSFELSYTVLENLGIYKNEGTSLWNFVLNSGL